MGFEQHAQKRPDGPVPRRNRRRRHMQAEQLLNARRSGRRASSARRTCHCLSAALTTTIMGLIVRRGTRGSMTAASPRRLSMPALWVTINELVSIRRSDTEKVGPVADSRITSPRLSRIKSCKQLLGMTGALLESQAPRIEELGRPDRCSSASTSTSTSASISTRSPPLYYGATPLAAGDDRRMNPQQLAKVPYPP
ncbi:ndt80 like dna-binding family protein [Colletotrichum graminicola]|nr:ndt80 like dna-binding family protein [Colletotrichum graminicola]